MTDRQTWGDDVSSNDDRLPPFLAAVRLAESQQRSSVATVRLLCDRVLAGSNEFQGTFWFWIRILDLRGKTDWMCKLEWCFLISFGFDGLVICEDDCETNDVCASFQRSAMHHPVKAFHQANLL